MSSVKVGIIGGTGLYKMEGLKTTETVAVSLSKMLKYLAIIIR